MTFGDVVSKIIQQTISTTLLVTVDDFFYCGLTIKDLNLIGIDPRHY